MDDSLAALLSLSCCSAAIQQSKPSQYWDFRFLLVFMFNLSLYRPKNQHFKDSSCAQDSAEWNFNRRAEIILRSQGRKSDP